MDRKELQQAVLEAQAQIQAQAQMALAEKMSSLCFKRCVSAPGDKLADRQRRCLDMCTQSFAEGFGVAVRAVRAGGSANTRCYALTPTPCAHEPPPRRARRLRLLRRNSRRQANRFRDACGEDDRENEDV